MTETKRVPRGELTSREVLGILKHGNRVIIEVEVLGKTLEMAIREQSGTYYCDTPMKLFTFSDEEELQTCLERYRLVKSDDGTEGEKSSIADSVEFE